MSALGNVGLGAAALGGALGNYASGLFRGNVGLGAAAAVAALGAYASGVYCVGSVVYLNATLSQRKNRDRTDRFRALDDIGLRCVSSYVSRIAVEHPRVAAALAVIAAVGSAILGCSLLWITCSLGKAVWLNATMSSFSKLLIGAGVVSVLTFLPNIWTWQWIDSESDESVGNIGRIAERCQQRVKDLVEAPYPRLAKALEVIGTLGVVIAGCFIGHTVWLNAAALSIAKPLMGAGVGAALTALSISSAYLYQKYAPYPQRQY
jgi:hypothetical protein